MRYNSVCKKRLYRFFMLMDFPKELSEREKELDEIRNTLSKTILLHKRSLNSCRLRIRRLFSKQSDDSKHKDLIIQLAGRYERLRTRSKVIEIAEKAEDLANQSPSTPFSVTTEGCVLLQRRISNLLENSRPTRTDMQFLRFAQQCMEKAENQEMVVAKKKRDITPLSQLNKPTEVSRHQYLLAENVLEMANLLHVGRKEDFLTALENSNEDVQMDIAFHVGQCSGDLENLEKPFPIIRGLMGYAAILTHYYSTSSPYPSVREVKNYLIDLDHINASI